MAKAKVYFPGLNGLRFLAAAAVIISHIELLKGSFGYTHHWNHPVFHILGTLGVVFFFVLSGFLITYLLLKEKEVTERISVKNFYLRRIFRIWPLYYIVFLIGFFLLPNFESMTIPYLAPDFENHFWDNFWLYLFIMPNLAFSMYNAVPHIGQSWSIGVEEQFYIIWPWLIKKSKQVFRLLIGFGVGLILLKVLVLFWYQANPDQRWLLILKNFLAMSKIECMVIGGVAAYFFYSKWEQLLKFCFHPIVHVLSWLLIPVLIYFTPAAIQDGVHIIYSFLFAIIILNVSCNSSSFLKLENKVFHELGKISYGVYMYHMMLIPMVLLLLKPLHNSWGDGIGMNILIYASAFILTIVVSYVSYHYVENFFIKMKKKYSAIESGNKE